ncbi:hypothetical protein BH11CYA1_BH11CYA1_48000 [soil metagenome]
MSYCYTESKEIELKRKQLAPWLAELDTTIQKHSQFRNVEKELLNQLDEQGFTTCFVSLKKDGTIKDLQVNSIDFKNIDQLITDVIRKSSPFKNPPNDLIAPVVGGAVKARKSSEVAQKIHSSLPGARGQRPRLLAS